MQASPPLRCVNPFQAFWPRQGDSLPLAPCPYFQFAFCCLPCSQEASAPWYAYPLFAYLENFYFPSKVTSSVKPSLIINRHEAFFLSFMLLWCFVYPSLPAGLSIRVGTLSRQGLSFILVCAKPRIWHQLDFRVKVFARQWSIMVH